MCLLLQVVVADGSPVEVEDGGKWFLPHSWHQSVPGTENDEARFSTGTFPKLHHIQLKSHHHPIPSICCKYLVHCCKLYLKLNTIYVCF